MDIAHDPAPGDRRRWGMILLASLSALLSWFCRNSLTVIFPEISRDLQLSAQELGLLSSLFFYFFAGSQLPLGFVLSRFGVRPVMSCGMLTAALGCLIFSMAGNASMAFTGRALIGMGTSVSVMGGMIVAAQWFSAARFALLSGMIMAVGGGGSLLATSPWMLLTACWGWRRGMLLVSAILLLTALGCWLIMRTPQSLSASSAAFSFRQAARAILFSGRFWLMGITTSCRYGFLGTLQAVWAGPLLVHGMGLSPITAGYILLLLALGYMASMPLVGWLSDSVFVSRKGVIFAGQLSLALLALSFLFWSRETPLWLVGLSFIILPLLAASGNVVFAHVKEINPPNLAPAAIAWTNIFPMLGGAIFIQFTSLLLPSDVSAIASPQALAHLWWLGMFSMGITAISYLLFIPESPVMQRRRASRKT